MSDRQLRTPAQDIRARSRETATPLVRQAFLVDRYTGYSTQIAVTFTDPRVLTRGAVVKAVVRPGVVLPVIPAGTPVSVRIYHGKVIILGLSASSDSTVTASTSVLTNPGEYYVSLGSGTIALVRSGTSLDQALISAGSSVVAQLCDDLGASIPAGAVAVLVELVIKSQGALDALVAVWDYGAVTLGTDGPGTGSWAVKAASLGGTSNAYTSGRAKTGGTNNRQVPVAYKAGTTGNATVTAKVIGYWLKEN